VITGSESGVDDETVRSALKILKAHTDEKDDAFFTRRGLKDARHFYAQFLHLAGVFVLDEGRSVFFVVNRDARSPLSSEVVRRLTDALSRS
jgi:hypothetical protein